MKSSFAGAIREIPGICVDNFENSSTDGARAYFLSHYHADHTVGLYSIELYMKLTKEKNVFIYATKMTCAIIQYHCDNLKEFVKILNLGSNLITIPGDESSNIPEVHLNVTLIPGGHSLGSTMFLFETTTSKVLFTGDFRIRPNDLQKYAAFHQNGDVIKLDALYVDTTFLEDQYEHFPKRSDTVEDLVTVISEWLDWNVHVLLDTSASYGYEHVFNYIYKVLKVRVCVPSDKWELYRTIHNLVPGVTNDPSETRIFLRTIPSNVKVDYQKTIRLSAMAWKNWNESESSMKGFGDYYKACFSTHCSRSELISFVEYLKPATIVGFPNYWPSTPMFKDTKTDTKMISMKRRSTELIHYKDKKVDSMILKKLFG